MRDLGRTAIQAFISIPKRGMEVGGLLFGQSRRDGSTASFDISVAEDVPCEHRFGPSYTLDDADRKRLAEMLARHGRDGSPPVVGFYRSYTGREAQWGDSDRELMRSFFSDRDLVYLLLAPLNAERCTGTFEFAIAEEKSPSSNGTARLPPFSVEEEPPVAAPESASAPATRTRGLVALSCFLAAVVGIVSFQLWRAGREPQRFTLGLDAQPSADHLVLRWDASSPAVRQSTRGVLAVSDGGSPLEIPLTPEQLRRGSYAFSPTGKDASFHLTLYADKEILAEDSLRVVPRPPEHPVASPPPAPHPVAAATAAAAAAAPALARREFQPDISPGIRRRLTAPVVVPVEVSIDARGRVTKATSNVKEHGLDRYLADEAVKAAYRWWFKPARSAEGLAVPSTTTISFHFTPARE
ncbi:MAG TPA: hypothetical protein VG456_22560 [Candidatus Sulfopaludibacter sp.]|jgi:hypothetical protein|nr:hypothetical protein [Candidatus Sulfopaludibacter sp.]